MLTWFGNQKTATKLMAGFALTGLLMAALAGVCLYNAANLRDNTDNIQNVQLKPLMTLTRTRGLVHQMRAQTVAAVLAQNPGDREAALAKVRDFNKQVDDNRDAFAKTIKADVVQKAYDRFVTIYDDYRNYRDSVIFKSLQEGKQADALTAMKGEGSAKFSASIDAINDLVETKMKIAQQKYDDSVQTFLTTRNVMLGASGAGIVLGLLFGWLLARSISQNLKEVNLAADKMAAGDLSARVAVTSKDEVGMVAIAFNDMAAKLEANAKSSLEFEYKMNAVGKAQAVIEFNMDGTIITANDNFLNCLGYSLDEIKGKHHRMFAEPAYGNSAEYQAFWAKLNRGEYDADVYRRLGKGGKEIWIQASYNPILDANGKPYKVVKFATDITAEKNRNAEFEGKMNAVGKAQAVIEFNMDGTIITANDNFLNCLGYSLDEIKGKHHRMFAEPAYGNSAEYQAFWAKLNRGEYDADVYRRLGKGGKEIWIQASYNPILDANGKPYKVVKFATDITGQKQAQNGVEKLIRAAAAGQLSERIKTEQFTGASKELTESFNRLLDSVATPLHEAQGVLSALAANDLTKSMTGNYQGEFEQMKQSLNSTLGNLNKTVALVRDAVDGVSAGAEQITKGNEDLSQRTSEQASSLEETSASMEEMTSTVKQNADNTKQANQLAIAARDTADKGGAVTVKAVEAMGEINKSSKKIADIITVIDEIAFQTNLLALNAAVEAARAGEHGRGFAVVAAEVRNLAQRSATAAKEIKGLINESIQRVNDGSELVNQSGKTLEEIVNSVKRVTDIIAEISAASQEQASGIDQVNKAIMSMDETTQQNAALVEETTSASQSMKEQAKELMRQVEVFKVSGTGSAPQRAVPVPVRHGSAPLQTTKRGQTPRADAKKGASPQPAGVGAGNGHDRRAKSDEFEEF